MNKFLHTILLAVSAIVLSGTAQAKVTSLETVDQVKAELSKPGPIALLYYATWCGACQEFHPIYDKLSDKMKSVRFYQMDLDKLGLKEHQGKVPYIPTLFVGKSESDLRNNPCEVKKKFTDLKAIEKQINRCLESK